MRLGGDAARLADLHQRKIALLHVNLDFNVVQIGDHAQAVHQRLGTNVFTHLVRLLQDGAGYRRADDGAVEPVLRLVERRFGTIDLRLGDFDCTGRGTGFRQRQRLTRCSKEGGGFVAAVLACRVRRSKSNRGATRPA